MKYLAFDIEIARDLAKIPLTEFQPDPGETIEIRAGETWVHTVYNERTIGSFDYWRPAVNGDWKRFRPLGITCAAAASSDGRLWNWWAHDEQGGFTPAMTGEQCRSLVNTLGQLSDEGYTVLSWNGLGFDFEVLGEESGSFTACKRLALDHIDMMFHFFCEKGFPLGLDAAAKGQGLPGKPEGMDGALAPVLWAEGQYHRVLDYVSWDVKNTLHLAQVIDGDAFNELRWTSRAGRPQGWRRGSRWLAVNEALELPEPDTSWMSNPMARSKFYEWTERAP
jgi:hypothetical protein